MSSHPPSRHLEVHSDKQHSAPAGSGSDAGVNAAVSTPTHVPEASHDVYLHPIRAPRISKAYVRTASRCRRSTAPFASALPMRSISYEPRASAHCDAREAAAQIPPARLCASRPFTRARTHVTNRLNQPLLRTVCHLHSSIHTPSPARDPALPIKVHSAAIDRPIQSQSPLRRIRAAHLILSPVPTRITRILMRDP
ncbi:hypothetical protein C2E23DRAFT_201773 [Lenzites betulinus]|nr:hypothetical protein C2E23DRAFT_201773 [Lenzites betulinus]